MEPAIDVLAPAGPVRAVVLLLHGGSTEHYGRVHRLAPPYLRMVPFGLAVRRRGDGVAAWLLRHRYRGWNAPHLHPVVDARRALARIRREHPGVPVVLVGHSMGGRTALRVADEAGVVAVCALAPWVEDDEPYRHLAGRSVLIAHGDRDRDTDPDGSRRYALLAGGVSDRVARFSVRGGGHTMLHRARDWTRLVTDFVAGELGDGPVAPYLAAAMREPASRDMAVPL
ncbi:alpha/beta hydrolase [Saccharothrix australiensis]|uniref:Serine aminopeptidase S33 family n=1 Tax=Saccharothrix australiensis TaxID=2072 RepID=A0A495W6M1_9PSEU|nr:alpha/beta fold hydrolase [Saccharothrix australiensis]RKT56303.1 serine aminopeptidase S33 family [Saccharothrix australiensis]